MVSQSSRHTTTDNPMYNQSNTCIIHSYGATPTLSTFQYHAISLLQCPLLHRRISYMHPPMTYISYIMVSYKYSASTSLGMLLIQNAPVPWHLLACFSYKLLQSPFISRHKRLLGQLVIMCPSISMACIESGYSTIASIVIMYKVP